VGEGEQLSGETKKPLDMVADTFTITCARAADIDYSSVYFTSHQRLLVRMDEPAESVEELVANADDPADAKVCAPAGSTSLRNLEALPDPPELVAAPSQGACLVQLQQGDIAAVSTDDTILAGMVAQDPNLHIVGEPFSTEPYGLGLPPDHPEWVRYVNGGHRPPNGNAESIDFESRILGWYDRHLKKKDEKKTTM
jgi:polar amino acid transport system substrate-binding protein